MAIGEKTVDSLKCCLHYSEIVYSVEVERLVRITDKVEKVSFVFRRIPCLKTPRVAGRSRDEPSDPDVGRNRRWPMKACRPAAEAILSRCESEPLPDSSGS